MRKQTRIDCRNVYLLKRNFITNKRAQQKFQTSNPLNIGADSFSVFVFKKKKKKKQYLP